MRYGIDGQGVGLLCRYLSLPPDLVVAVTNGTPPDSPNILDAVDLDGEKRYLGAALMAPKAIADHDLDPQTFFREEHRTVYRAIAQAYRQGYDPDDAFASISALIRKELQPEEASRLMPLMTEMIALSEPWEALDGVADHLRELAIRRRIIRLPYQIERAAATITDIDRLASRISALTDFATRREEPSGPTPTEVSKPAPPSRTATYTDTQLAEMDLPPVAEVIPGLFGAGHYLLSGAPKMGKSFLVMSMAFALSQGGAVLGAVMVAPRDVLYLCLEDGLRRTVTRLRQRANEFGTSGRLHFAFDWPAIDDGGLEYLRAWLADHPDGVVFIDTGKRLRQGDTENGKSYYASDYDFISPITDLAHAHDTLIVTVWHDRKMLADDFFDQVNASRGLTAAVDGVAQLSRERGSKEAKLSIGDRDTEDRAFTLRWDEVLLGWLLIEKTEVSATKQSGPTLVYAAIKRMQTEDMGVTADMVAAETGLPKGSVKNHFTTLRGQGVIQDVGRGRVHTVEDDSE